MEIKKTLKKCSFPKIVFQFDTDEEVLEFLVNWENKDKAVFSVNNQRTELMQKIHEKVKNAIGSDVPTKLEKENKQIKTDVNIVEQTEASIFDISGDGFEVKDLDFTEVEQTFLKLNITKKQVVEVLNNKRTYTYGIDGELDFVGFTEKSKFLCIFVDCNERKPKVLSVEIGTEKQIFIYCHGQEN